MSASAEEQTMTTAAPRHPAAYIRVADPSTDDVLLQRQRAAVLSAARERGWPEPAVYTDIGPSGWQRPGSDLARLAADIGRGQRDAVITAGLYRISRSAAGTAGFAEHCASHDVTLGDPRRRGRPGPARHSHPRVSPAAAHSGPDGTARPI